MEENQIMCPHRPPHVKPALAPWLRRVFSNSKVVEVLTSFSENRVFIGIVSLGAGSVVFTVCQ